MSLKSINPYNNKVLRDFEEFSDDKIIEILSHSLRTFENWKKTGSGYRKSLMEKVSEVLRAGIKGYSGAITSEMGKPVNESRLEVEKCAWVCDYYAKNSEKFLAPEIIETDADNSYVSYEPLGPVLGIMPWNFPFWQVFRFAVPTMMAGNTVLLKHASNVQICAEMIENIFTEAGFPRSVFSNLVVGSDRMERIIRHEVIKGVSLTGSELAGRKVAEIAGQYLKKCVLELGGSNAFIVLDDADIRKAAETGVKARFQNAGQSCIAAKRFIIDRKISEKFLSLFLEGIGKLKSGDPADRNTDIGPLSDTGQAEKVEEQVRKSVSMGARVIAGGSRDGAFFKPSVVIGVRPGMPLFDEEVFGPVASVTIADDTRDAVALASKTTFGLGVSVFTNDLKKAEELSHEFHDGSVFVNGLVKSDPRLPFGGTRHSGFGRELSIHGIREFVNVKSVWIKK